jgi:5-hydroxyisourate hydrolase
MATVSSHTLSSVDGTHAGGIGVALHRLDPSGARVTLFETATDEGGRLSETVALDPDARYHIPLMLAPNSYSVWWSS